MHNVKRLVIIAVIFALISVTPLYAQFSSSNYRIDESYIGPGGYIDSSSALYTGRASLGDTGIGNTASNTYQAFGGYTTADDEYLEIVVTGGTVDLGVQDPTVTATGNATFYVRSYIAQGYVVYSFGGPPTSENGDQIAGMALGSSVAGTEQFGINLVANTSPAVFGADPVQQPDNTFSFGYAATGYDTSDNYKYSIGDVIAKADSSSGRTDYTISYIMNISPLTPAGKYTMEHSLVATSTF